LIIISIIFLSALIFLLYNDSKQKIENSKICFSDSDCIKVQTSCCPCNMGGVEQCILKKESLKYSKELLNCSINQICSAVYSCKISSCSCVKGECIANEN